ncbi:hypothetical protein MMC09_007016 [Bachmanniomyces sp. S44760]|nr:hypothetical protein [Bachmanniomyces sp. S44760]
MLPPSLGRATRGPSCPRIWHSVSCLQSSRAPPASHTRPIFSNGHQHRRSSSKPSNPHNDDSRSIAAASKAPAKAATRTTKDSETKQPVPRLTRRKSKVVVLEGVEAGKAGINLTLPSVPSTQHLHPHDIHIASFFSIHRPMSVTTSIPRSSSFDAFFSIFTPRESKRPRPEDVIFTLSSAVSSLDNAVSESRHPNPHHEQSLPSRPSGTQRTPAEEVDLRSAIESASSTNLEQQTSTMQTGNTLSIPTNVLDLAKNFRPFMPPPVPVPMDEHATEDLPKSSLSQQMIPPGTRFSQRHSSKPQVTRKTFSTVLTILESTHPNGQKTYSASNTPIREETPHPNHPTPLLRLPHNTNTSKQPFLDRMHSRHETWLDHRDQAFWQAISVKRQRKLKMKKHKYKKLMRRTRNLRRRLDRT